MLLYGPRDDSLEIYSDTQLDDSSRSSCNEYMNTHPVNNELAIGCEKLLKDNLLKKKSFALKEENENLSSKLDLILRERDEISNGRDSLKSQLELALKENKILKNKNDYDLSLIHI